MFFFFFLEKIFLSLNLYNKKAKSFKVSRSHSKKTVKQRKASCKHRLNRFEKYKLVNQLAVVINRRFPDLLHEFSQMPDYRKRPVYDVKELIVSGLLVFLFKQKSRNQADNSAKNLDYQDNIKSILGVKVADMDTVDKYLRFLSADKLEDIKHSMFKTIVKSKVFQKYKFNGQYFMLAIDGSGLQSFDYEPYLGCPYKEFKSGRKVWTTYVLEAKIITENGFAISLATQWIENPTDKAFDKQDSENKAFKRLGHKLKKDFPRLPLMLLLDGLYPTNPVFTICKQNNWSYIITLKDNSLKSIQEQLSDHRLFNQYGKIQRIDRTTTHWLINNYKIFEDLDYKGHQLSVIETNFEKQHLKTGEKENTRFVHITNINIDKKNAHQISQAGRMRWKIENEGFNNQKNNDYSLQHKFSRTNFNATKNYYQLIQMADIINQFIYKQKAIQQYLKDHGFTTRSIISDILSYLKSMEFSDKSLIDEILFENTQARY